MTPSQIEALKELSDEGYAVIVFSPEELEGADPGNVEDRLIETGWEVIEWSK